MEIKTFAVVGAGQMGGGIAQVAAQAGLQVVLADASGDLARKGVEKISAGLSKLVEKGKMTGEVRTQVLSRIQPGDSLQACAGADFVVEAIIENEGVKRELFG